VKRLQADGTATIVAGAVDDCAFVDGANVIARFQLPEHLVLFGDKLFISDGTALRRLSLATGAVDTVAGVKSSGGLAFPIDGVGTSARFGEFRAMAVDANGNIWVSDTFRLRKVTTTSAPPPPAVPAFQVTTVAGGASAPRRHRSSWSGRSTATPSRGSGPPGRTPSRHRFREPLTWARSGEPLSAVSRQWSAGAPTTDDWQPRTAFLPPTWDSLVPMGIPAVRSVVRCRRSVVARVSPTTED
jgi:hypothetical protein